MKNVIIISDFFLEDFKKIAQPAGGAELNDSVLFDHLDTLGIVKAKVHTTDFPKKEMTAFLKRNKNCTFLLSNFNNLPFECTVYLMENCRYFIYEHDYKFHKNRNPIAYDGFVVPGNEIVNYNFYHRAEELICLSKLHYDIFKDNLNVEKMHNTTCSLWSDDLLDHIENLLSVKKNAKVAVIDTDNPIKRRDDCVRFCKSKGMDYDLIKNPDPKEFLKMLAKYKAVVILPGHPEPTPRIAVEAKMLNCKLLSNKKTIGVAYEDWFSLNGKELIEEVKNIRYKALTYITGRITSEV
jgi:hypothetical protein